MPHQIMPREAPASIEAITGDSGFRLSYVAANESDDATAGHWDHVAIFASEADHTPVYEDWHTEEALTGRQSYQVDMDISVPLEAGEYLVAVTLDGGATATDGEANPAPYYLTVPLSVREPSGDGAGNGGGDLN